MIKHETNKKQYIIIDFMTKIQYNIIDYMTHNRYNTILWHWRMRINLVDAIMDDYDTFPRNSAKRIFDIGYSGKSTYDSKPCLKIFNSIEQVK